MAALSFQDLAFELDQHWLTAGPPAETLRGAGTLYSLMEKGAGLGNVRWDGEDKGLIPLKTDVGRSVGANYGSTFNNYRARTGVRYFVPYAQCFTHMRLDPGTMDATRDPSSNRSRRSSVALAMTDAAQAFTLDASYTIWNGGTGRRAKGNGVYSVAGTTITLKNRQSAIYFAKGDLLVAIDQAAVIPADGMPTPRVNAQDLVVVGINENAGTITTNVPISTAIPTVVNTDWFGKVESFDGSRVEPVGIFSWIPITATEAATTRFQVVRGNDPTKLSGHRFKVSVSDSPWSVLMQMIAYHTRVISPKDKDPSAAIFVPASWMEPLLEETRAGFTITAANAEIDRTRFVFGASGWDVSSPQGKYRLYIDQYLHDPEVADTDDRTAVMLALKQWGLSTAGRSGPAWLTDDGLTGSLLRSSPGIEGVSAPYGWRGNHFCLNPWVNIVASTRADQ